MDGTDLFRKLCVGAKFDFKRFNQDATRLKVISAQQRADTTKNTSSIETSTTSKVKTVNNTRKRRGNTQNAGDIKKIRSNLQKKDEDGSDSESESTVSDLDNTNSGSSSDSSPLDSEGQLSSDEDDSDDASDEPNEEEEEEELKLLGNITSKEKEPLQRIQKKNKKKTREKLLALKTEEISRIRNQNKIHFQGTDVPDPIKSFGDLQTEHNIHPQILHNIEASGYRFPTPIQMQAIPAMLSGRELMACAPTGSGKTAAFIIPLLHLLKEPSKRGLRALVLAPTRELASQIYREFQRLGDGMGFRICHFEKGTSEDKTNDSKSIRKFDILVSTPNRLVYMIKQDPPTIKLNSIEWLVIDESDKLFEDGKTGFRDQLATIYQACNGTATRRAMFSATFAYDVEQWCKLNLDNVIHVYIGSRNSATQTIEQELKFVGSESGKLYAVRDIIRKGVQPPILIFVQSRERAKELFHELIYDGLNADIIHSDRTQEQRDNVVKCFRSGKIWILICTELLGRGIDFKGVNLVINFDFPNSAISYIHRIGRTGRAGRPGKAVTFFTEDDAVNLRSIANVMVEAGCPVPEYMLKIKRPSKKTRRKLAKRIPERDRISTISQYDLDKAKRRRNIILKKMGKQINQKSGKNKENGKSKSTAKKNFSKKEQYLKGKLAKAKPQHKKGKVKRKLGHKKVKIKQANANK